MNKYIISIRQINPSDNDSSGDIYLQDITVSEVQLLRLLLELANIREEEK